MSKAKGQKHIAEANPQVTPKAYADMVQAAVDSVKLDWPGVTLEVSTQPNINRGDVYRHAIIVALYPGRDTEGVIVNKTINPSIADTPDKVVDLVSRLIMKAFYGVIEKRLQRSTTVPLTVSSYPRVSATRLSA